MNVMDATGVAIVLAASSTSAAASPSPLKRKKSFLNTKSYAGKIIDPISGQRGHFKPRPCDSLAYRRGSHRGGAPPLCFPRGSHMPAKGTHASNRIKRQDRKQSIVHGSKHARCPRLRQVQSPAVRIRQDTNARPSRQGSMEFGATRIQKNGPIKRSQNLMSINGLHT